MSQEDQDGELFEELFEQELTPQEVILRGSTIPQNLDTKLKESEEAWRIPLGVLLERLTVEQARDAREKLGHISISPIVYRGLGLSEGDTFAIKLEDLDLKTGEAKSDPQVLGFWDSRQKRVVEAPGRDLTKELYEACKRKSLDLHLRPTQIQEHENPPGGELKG